MKHIKARKDLIFIVNPLLIVAGILLFCYFSREIIACFQLLWVVTLCVLLLIVTPLGNLTLSNPTADQQRLSLLPWFLRILLLELVFIGVYYGISLLNTHLSINGLSDTSLFTNTLQTELIHTGLFPWNIYALITIGMSAVAYREQFDAYFSQITRFSTQPYQANFFNLVIDTGARRLTLFAISSTLLFTTLFLIRFFAPSKTPLVMGFQTSALLTTFVILVFSFSQFAKNMINRIFSWHVSKWYSFPVFCVILGMIILVLSMLTSVITQQTTAQTPPAIITDWMAFNARNAWMIFSTFWWICFTPLVCGFLSRISKGYSIRTVLIGILLLPFLISLFYVSVSHHWITPFHISDMILKILSIIAFIILLPLLVNNETVPNAILSYFPKDGLIKHRDSQPFFQHVAQLTVAMLYFYLTIGINGISLFIFAPNYYSMLILLIASIAIIKHCFITRK